MIFILDYEFVKISIYETMIVKRYFFYIKTELRVRHFNTIRVNFQRDFFNTVST